MMVDPEYDASGEAASESLFVPHEIEGSPSTTPKNEQSENHGLRISAPDTTVAPMNSSTFGVPSLASKSSSLGAAQDQNSMPEASQLTPTDPLPSKQAPNFNFFPPAEGQRTTSHSLSQPTNESSPAFSFSAAKNQTAQPAFGASTMRPSTIFGQPSQGRPVGTSTTTPSHLPPSGNGEQKPKFSFGDYTPKLGMTNGTTTDKLNLEEQKGPSSNGPLYNAQASTFKPGNNLPPATEAQMSLQKPPQSVLFPSAKRSSSPTLSSPFAAPKSGDQNGAAQVSIAPPNMNSRFDLNVRAEPQFSISQPATLKPQATPLAGVSDIRDQSSGPAPLISTVASPFSNPNAGFKPRPTERPAGSSNEFPTKIQDVKPAFLTDIHSRSATNYETKPDLRTEAINRVTDALVFEKDGLIKQYVEIAVGPVIQQIIRQYEREKSCQKARQSPSYCGCRAYMLNLNRSFSDFSACQKVWS